MTTAIGPATQQGVISTQVERAQNDKPQAAAQAPAPQESAPPPPPPPESGRGASVDVTA